MTLYRHKKTGGIYTLNGMVEYRGGANFAPEDQDILALMQDTETGVMYVCDAARLFPDLKMIKTIMLQARMIVKVGDPLICYENKDGDTFARPPEEFYDGRFERVENVKEAA